TLAPAGEGSGGDGVGPPSGRDQSDLLVGAVLDDEVADHAGDVAIGIELGRARRAVVVDLLAGGDRRLGLGPFAGLDDLARGAADLAQRVADLGAVGRAGLL